jgi:hypothetical protein
MKLKTVFDQIAGVGLRTKFVPLAELPPLPEAPAPHAATAYLHEGAAWIEVRHEEFFDSLAPRMAA